jgi:hypothetical protein
MCSISSSKLLPLICLLLHCLHKNQVHTISIKRTEDINGSKDNHLAPISIPNHQQMGFLQINPSKGINLLVQLDSTKLLHHFSTLPVLLVKYVVDQIIKH